MILVLEKYQFNIYILNELLKYNIISIIINIKILLQKKIQIIYVIICPLTQLCIHFASTIHRFIIIKNIFSYWNLLK